MPQGRADSGAAGNVAEDHAENGAGPGEEEVRGQAPPFVNVLPAEQQKILFQNGLDLRVAEALADGAAMLVVDHAARLVEHLPAALPGHVAEVGVFQVEGREQLVEAAEFEELVAVEGAGAAAAVEAREEIGDGGVDAMAHAQAAILPPALREAGLLAELVGVAEEDLAGDGEDAGIAEAFEQRRKEIGGHAHVAVEQHDDVVFGGAEAGVRAAAEAEILVERDQFHLRESSADDTRRCRRWSRYRPR